MAFVHFGIHSEFSITDSIVRIKQLVKHASGDNQVALALTDLSNLYAAVKFYRACLSEGIKPIIGAEILMDNDSTSVMLLVSDQTGYKNLTQIVSYGFTDGQVLGKPIVPRDYILANSEGIIVLFTEKSDVGQAMLSSHPEKAQTLLENWQVNFGDRLYLAVKRTGRNNEDRFIEQAIHLSNALNVPIIAHNDVRFLVADDFEAHEARVCIANSQVLGDPNRPRDYSPEQYLKTQAQMAQLFADMPAVIDNTLDLAKRCNVVLTLGINVLPEFPVPDGETTESFFRQTSQQGLERRLTKLYPPEKRGDDWADIRKPYDERLEFEINTILNMGFPGYFLIVMDFIRWAKANDVPVGPGRGSGAGSLVAYSLDITDLDPLAYDLLFERFLNPERVSMPDFDVDFCIEGRDRVIDYVARQYGREAVSQIITFGTMAARAVVRDVARVQGKSYGLADKISKLIPKTPGISLKEAVEGEPQLKDLLSNPANMDFDDANEIWEMAIRLEGVTRGVGKHAGGVLIAPNKITDFSAVYCDEDGSRVSQFDKDDVEAVGLVKFDFLGLRNLTVINAAIKHINSHRANVGEPPLDLDTLPLDDKPTYGLLKKALTTAVFQLESSGMKKYLAKLEPSNIEDVIAMCALYRPGPLDAGMVEMYIERKHGREEVIYDHDRLEPILENTYGVIVYQEQVMQISQAMAGYSLGGADMLRRAMGKKKPEEMAKQRSIFIEGSIKEGIDEATAGGVFDLMEKFAGYGFNKSHSAAYGVLAYQTAYLKHYYPAEFMSAVITSDMNNTDNVVFLINDCRENFKLTVENPCVNHSNWEFVPKDKSTIVYGLGAIKGVGEGAVESIVIARSTGGNFSDLYDFCRRVDTKRVNKRTLEALVKAGCFDVFAKHLRPDLPPAEKYQIRGALMMELPKAVQAAEQQRQNEQLGIMDMFAEIAEVTAPPPLPHTPMWTDNERLKGEKDTLGLFLTGHPLDSYRDEIQRYTNLTLSDLKETGYGETAFFAGLILDVANFGNRVVIYLDDGTGRLEVSCYAERFSRFKDKLKPDAVVIIEGTIRDREGTFYASVNDVLTLTDARLRWLKQISIKIAGDDVALLENLQTLLNQADNSTLHQLSHQMGNAANPNAANPNGNNDTLQSQSKLPNKPQAQSVALALYIYSDYSMARIDTPEPWQIIPDETRLEQLKHWVKPENLHFEYN